MENQAKTLMPASPAVFHLMLALGVEERHGYDLMKQVRQDTHGEINMGPGTLYGCLKRMLQAGLIEQTDKRADALTDERRRYYRLSNLGMTVLALELKRYADALTVAAKRKLVNVGNLGVGNA